MERQGIAVVAVGGNALIKDKAHQTVQDQFNAANDTMQHIVDMIQKGWDVVVTHGNGPQVGFILRRSELASHELHEIPLDYCGADTQGAIGYMFQNSLQNEFKRRGMQKDAATIVTQTIVDKDDPAFQNPTKPIGSFMDEAEALRRAPKMRAGQWWKTPVAAGAAWCLHQSPLVLSKRK
jgi:carbamate kinase